MTPKRFAAMWRTIERMPQEHERTLALLRDLLIVALHQAGASREAIERIVRCDMARVDEIVRALRPTAEDELREDLRQAIDVLELQADPSTGAFNNRARARHVLERIQARAPEDATR
ncbi:MAG: hypothetical protein ACJ79R_20565 [Anaeromyxobacteraceae bacterium]